MNLPTMLEVPGVVLGVLALAWAVERLDRALGGAGADRCDCHGAGMFGGHGVPEGEPCGCHPAGELDASAPAAASDQQIPGPVGVWAPSEKP